MKGQAYPAEALADEAREAVAESQGVDRDRRRRIGIEKKGEKGAETEGYRAKNKAIAIAAPGGERSHLETIGTS